MVDVDPTITISFNMNGANAAVKRQRLSDWIEKQEQTIHCLQKIHFRYTDFDKLKENG